MNLRRALAALVLVPAVLGATACTSSGGGKSPKTNTAGGTPSSATDLATRMEAAVAKLTSAHFTLDVTVAGQALTGAGDEKLDNGKLVALDVVENLPSNAGSIQIISVGGRTYAKLPASLNTSGKPYLLVTKNSSNSLVRQLASSLDTALSSASLGSTSVFVKATKSLAVKGTETVNGAPATHYSMQVDVAKLPDTLPGKEQIVSAGLDTIPIELYVDSQGRPVKITETLKVQGSEVNSTVAVSEFNKPVTITAPPASQVGS